MNLEETIINNLIAKNLELAKNVREGVRGSTDEAYSFIISCVKDIIFCDRSFDKEKLKKVITDGGEDAEMDVFYEDDTTIHIMDIKNTEKIETNSFEKFKNSLIKYIFNQADDKEIKKLNPRIKSQLEIFYKDTGDKKIKIYIIRNSINKFNKKDKDTLNEIVGYANSEIIFLNRTDLINSILLTENFDHNWSFKIDKNDITYKKGINEFILKISLFELFNLVKKIKYDNKDLFAKNVRTFINNKSLSDGIIDTILNKPKTFHLYHNGITFSVFDVQIKAKNTFVLVNPQIINGCQTVNTIYEYFKDKPNNEILKETKVFCRIYKLEKKDIEKVCEASNTQVKIAHSDLRSNDDVQVKLEKFINSIPEKEYFYERKRGVKKTKKKVITMGDLGQWLYSCKFEEPADSKNKKAELFEIASTKSLYKNIFLDSFDPKEIEFICDCGFFVKEKIKSKSKKIRKILKYADLHIMCGMFLLKKINTNSFNRIVKIIDEIIKIPPLSKYRDDYNKIFTKDKETWELIKKKLKK